MISLIGFAGIVRGLTQRTLRGWQVGGSLGALVLVCVALMLVADPVIRLVFGDQFAAAATPMRILLVGAAATHRYDIAQDPV